MNSPATRRVRAYFAPVARATGTPTLWDPAGLAAFNVDAPPTPWLDLGWCARFTRHSATKINPLLTGAPATASSQVRAEIDAQVSLEFESWGKLQLALSSGVQQFNVLDSASSALIASGSTAVSLSVGPAFSGFNPGDLVVVDQDYGGTTGFTGAAVSGGYVRSPTDIGADPAYVRRVSLNVARVTQSVGGSLTLAAPLLAGTPAPGMQVARVLAFCDREGGSFFQEWSALFLVEGQQGERIAYHYPRLQAMTPAAESAVPLAPDLARLRLPGHFRALPARDPLDGENIVCYRAYLPSPFTTAP